LTSCLRKSSVSYECSHLEREAAAREKVVASFSIVANRCRNSICCCSCPGIWRAGIERLVHPGAGRERCHGANLEGAMGPALVGKQFWLAYGGKKISTLWSTVHTQMPMMAPGSISVRNSINIMAFLLQKNGLPSGSRPLDDTVDLSKALPVK
jgi:hypothetical protein